MLSIDTHILFAALEASAPHHAQARAFLESHGDNDALVICEPVLVELYLMLRNPAVVTSPLSTGAASRLIQALRQNPKWRLVENAPVMATAWEHAGRDPFARRRLIDVRLALTLRHHGVTEFATVNVADFQDVGFHKTWNPLAEGLTPRNCPPNKPLTFIRRTVPHDAPNGVEGNGAGYIL
jgi:toxin-antitoxin system PIN domain toxin